MKYGINGFYEVAIIIPVDDPFIQILSNFRTYYPPTAT